MVLSNYEAKQKAIREAYGDDWDRFKKFVRSLDGWCFVFAKVDERKYEYKHKYTNCQEFRPRSLTLLDNNNGWNRIEGPDSLPKVDGPYIVLGKSGKIEDFDFINHAAAIAVWVEYFTHWRPLTRIELPIY